MKPGSGARADAIFTKGRAPALGPAKLRKVRPAAAMLDEGSLAAAGEGAIFVEGEGRSRSVSLSGSWASGHSGTFSVHNLLCAFLEE